MAKTKMAPGLRAWVTESAGRPLEPIRRVVVPDRWTLLRRVYAPFPSSVLVCSEAPSPTDEERGGCGACDAANRPGGAVIAPLWLHAMECRHFPEVLRVSIERRVARARSEGRREALEEAVRWMRRHDCGFEWERVALLRALADEGKDGG